MFEIKKENRCMRLFFPDKFWVEGAAPVQLQNSTMLEGMAIAAGFPDLHPGKGIPVGVAFLNRDKVLPHLVGNLRPLITYKTGGAK